METTDIFQNIWAMKKQEMRYLSLDYLNDGFQLQSDEKYNSEGSLDPTKPVDQECRFRIVDWCYQLVDFCKFDHDTVAISMNYLDRFLSTKEGADARRDRGTFQLAAMTCLYTAIKTHETEAIAPRIISDLSKGNYSEKQVIDMEQKILVALRWRMNPPTPLAFTHSFLSLIPEKTISARERLAITELAKYQTESAVAEYRFLSYDSSCIALASLSNAIQTVRKGYFHHILNTLSKISGIDLNSQTFNRCREELWVSSKKLRYYQANLLIRQSSTVSKTVGSAITVYNSPRGVDTTSLWQ